MSNIWSFVDSQETSYSILWFVIVLVLYRADEGSSSDLPHVSRTLAPLGHSRTLALNKPTLLRPHGSVLMLFFHFITASVADPSLSVFLGSVHPARLQPGFLVWFNVFFLSQMLHHGANCYVAFPFSIVQRGSPHPPPPTPIIIIIISSDIRLL